MHDSASVRLSFHLTAITITRVVVTTGYRMVYAFLPVIARGLGVSLGAVALAVTGRSAVALISPALGAVSDLRGRRAGAVVGLGLVVVGLLSVALWPNYAVFFAGLLVAAAGRYMLDTSSQAYLGDQVTYRRRGLAIALAELSWSLSFLVVMPLVGWSMDRAGWSAPFVWLAVVAALFGVVLGRLLPAGRPRPDVQFSLRQALGEALRHRNAVAALGVSLLISLSNQMINIVYGAWLEGAFGLPVTTLGASAMVIGVAELGGEGLVATLSDRMGKRRAVVLGIGINLVAGLVLPVLGHSLAGALFGLFLFYLGFEFALVSGFALFTELAPAARGTLMASLVTANELGRGAGALLGPWLFGFGLVANGGAAVILDLLAVLVLLRYVKAE